MLFNKWVRALGRNDFSLKNFQRVIKQRDEHAEADEDNEGEQRFVAPEGGFAAPQQKDEERGEGKENQKKEDFGANQMVQPGADEAPDQRAAGKHAHEHQAGAGPAFREGHLAAGFIRRFPLARARQHVDDANDADHEAGEYARKNGVHRACCWLRVVCRWWPGVGYPLPINFLVLC